MPGGPLVVDASVALKWIVPEPDSDRAAALAAEDLHAPELLDLEVANALRTIVARGALRPPEAGALYARFLALPVTRHPASAPLAAAALDLGLALGHPVYDCLYLALAEALDAGLVTSDRRFVRAVEADAPRARRIRLL